MPHAHRAVTPPAPGSATAVLDHLPDVVVRYDAQGRILYVNDAFVAVTGATREEVVGQPASALQVSPETIDRFAAARSEVFATGRATSFDIRRVLPTGERCVEYLVIPERAADGSIPSVV